MRRALATTVISSLAVVGLLVAAEAALACSCAGPRPGEERAFYREALKDADGAIIGKLLRKRQLGGEPEPGEAVPVGGPAAYVYRVRRAFKKQRRFPRGRIVRVIAPSEGPSCGIEQRVGTRGGLFLHRRNGRWSSGLCSQVSPRWLRRAADDRASAAASTSTDAGCQGAAA